MHSFRSNLWFAWTTVTVAGVIAGLAIGTWLHSLTTDASILIPLDYLAILITGAIVGAGQWWVLSDALAGTTPADGNTVWEWVMSTIIGVGLGTLIPGVLGMWGVPGLLYNEFLSPLGTTIGGAILGICQWRVLSGYVMRSGWWIAAVALAGTVLQLISLLDISVSYLIGVLVSSLICGLSLTWLLTEQDRQHSLTRVR